MADDRRMTTDRFYGGVSGRLQNLRAMLKYVDENTPPREQVAEWVVENTQAGSINAVNHHLTFLQSIDFLHLSDTGCELGDYGRLYLDEHDPTTFYEALSSGVKGFDTLLEALAEEPMTDEEIMELFVTEFKEAEMTTPGPAARHREWLEALGFVRRTDGINELTEEGRKLISSAEGSESRKRREMKKIEQLRSALLENEMSCVPQGRQHLSENIYPAIKSSYPDLCNDEFLCEEAHDSGRPQPEWKHAVRDIQQRLASRNGTRVHRQDEQEMWLFESESDEAATDSDPIEIPSGNEATERRETTVNRIQRNRVLVDRMKDLYDHTCQVCGDRRQSGPDEGFSHVHHLMPLGEPHDGPDVPENTVVVCPNHHEDFEHGMLVINPQTKEIHHFYEEEVDGCTVETREDHELGAQYLAYHNEVMVK